jgi:hypothetical protein
MNMTVIRRALCALMLVCTVAALAQETPKPADADAAYTRTINVRADKIVAMLGIDDPAKATRVRDLIAGQYRSLGTIHDARDAQIKAAKELPDKQAADAAVKAAREAAQAKLDPLHKEFLARLSAELAPEQLDKVKDGMTYDVLHVTYSAYLKQYPDLTDEQKQQITAWLIEAREGAMDMGSSEEKHAVFGKYKGRINNYLSKAGYDLKTGKKKPETTAPETK